VVLQFTTYIEKSAVFILQQSVFFGIASFAFLLPFYWQASLAIQVIGAQIALVSQMVLFCLYVGLRYRLTYRDDGAMNVVFGFKTIHLIVVGALSAALLLANGELAVIVGLQVIVKLLSLILFVLLVYRRGRVKENEVAERTVLSYFLFITMYWVLFYILFYAMVEKRWLRILYFNYPYFTLTDVKYLNNFIQETLWILPMLLSILLLNPFFTIFIDDKLRRTFFEMFHLPRYCCLCNDRELLAPLLPEQEPRPQHNVYNEPHQVPEAQPR